MIKRYTIAMIFQDNQNDSPRMLDGFLNNMTLHPQKLVVQEIPCRQSENIKYMIVHRRNTTA